MYIGQAAQRSGATIKSIRHYEAIGLLPPARRRGNYRIYDQATVDLLVLIKCAQALGFTLAEMQALMLAEPASATPRERILAAVAQKQIQVRKRITSLEQQLAELHAFELSLEQLPDHCYPHYPPVR